MVKENIAIIGGGIAGLTSAYLLSDLYEVKLFEKQGRVGGNAHTFKTKTDETLDVSVFLYSSLGYPNFFKLLSKLNLENKAMPSRNLGMSTHNLDSGKNLLISTAFKALFNPTLWKSIPFALITGFAMKRAYDLYDQGEFDGMSLEEALEKLEMKPGSPAYLITTLPITLSSSMVFKDVLKAPAAYFFGKMKHHAGDIETLKSAQLLSFRTQEYIDRLVEPVKEKVQLNSHIKSVERNSEGVLLHMEDGKTEKFDKVVFACHANQALDLIGEPSKAEEELLGAWRYQPGTVLVHTDKSKFPKKKDWALYDYLYTRRKGVIETSINAAYRFQYGMPDNSDYLGTQHPNYQIEDDKIEFKKTFYTPIFDEKSMASREKLPSLNGVNHSYFCGSHFGWGLHEDAISSAVDLSKSLGANW